jgi:hypothetical protein
VHASLKILREPVARAGCKLEWPSITHRRIGTRSAAPGFQPEHPSRHIRQESCSRARQGNPGSRGGRLNQTLPVSSQRVALTWLLEPRARPARHRRWLVRNVATERSAGCIGIIFSRIAPRGDAGRWGSGVILQHQRPRLIKPGDYCLAISTNRLKHDVYRCGSIKRCTNLSTMWRTFGSNTR